MAMTTGLWRKSLAHLQRGSSMPMPHKVALLHFLDTLPSAERTYSSSQSEASSPAHLLEDNRRGMTVGEGSFVSRTQLSTAGPAMWKWQQPWRAAHGEAAGSGAHEGEEMSEATFHKLSDDVLHRLQENLDELGDELEIDAFDCSLSQGVLTVRLGDHGTYVINKQTPNRQIWLSSPLSGPARFDYDQSSKKWIYRRKKFILPDLLEEELTKLLDHDIRL
eukprot:jgi/Mesen1/2124/ME000152S01215